MADDDNGTAEGTSDEGMVSRSQIRQLEKKASKAEELEAKLAEFERREAFRDAGIDSTDPKMGYFIKGYDGEITAEAIRKAAQDAGFIDPPGRTPEQDQQLTAEQRMAAAAAAGQPEGSALESKVREEMEAAFREGGQGAMLNVARQYGAVVSDDLM